MRVIIIGTSHVFQFGAPPDCSETEATEFRTYLTALCIEHGAKAIGEEMNSDALAERGVTTSACKIVADQMKLQHAYCDPNLAERAALQIRDENLVKMTAFRKLPRAVDS